MTAATALDAVTEYALDVIAGRVDLLSGRSVVLTPHDGEFARLVGEPVADDRIASARGAAEQTGCTVLLKGPTTVIADPAGRVGVMADGRGAGVWMIYGAAGFLYEHGLDYVLVCAG